MNKLQTLKALLKESTQGMWREEHSIIKSSVIADHVGDKVISLGTGWRTLDEYQANIDLILEAHNSLPDIIKSLEIALDALNMIDTAMHEDYCRTRDTEDIKDCCCEIRHANQALQEINNLL